MMICERFPGYTLKRINEELDEDQIEAMLAYCRKIMPMSCAWFHGSKK